MLRGENNGVNPQRTVFLIIFDRHLCFSIGAQIGQRSALAYLSQPQCKPVGQRDRQRHKLGGFVAGEAEHHPLISGAVFSGIKPLL